MAPWAGGSTLVHTLNGIYIDRFSRFMGLTIVTDRPADRSHYSVTIGHVYVVRWWGPITMYTVSGSLENLALQRTVHVFSLPAQQRQINRGADKKRHLGAWQAPPAAVPGLAADAHAIPPGVLPLRHSTPHSHRSRRRSRDTVDPESLVEREPVLTCTTNKSGDHCESYHYTVSQKRVPP